MDAAEALAVVVRGIRRGQGLSQEDVNSIGRSHLSRIERGELSITLDVLVRLAGILDLDPAALILMATSLQAHESFKDGLKRLSKQLNRIKKAGIDLEIESLVRAGKLPPGRPARSEAAANALEAQPAAAPHAVLLNRLVGVLRAGRVEAARGGQPLG